MTHPAFQARVEIHITSLRIDPERILLLIGTKWIIFQLQRISSRLIVLALHVHRLDDRSDLGRVGDVPVAINGDRRWLDAKRFFRCQKKNQKRDDRLHP